MTLEQRIETMQVMLGEDVEDNVLEIYLNLAKQKILNHRFPYGTNLTDVEPQYESDLLELAVVLYSQRGAEGEEYHKENGVDRRYRTEASILASIPAFVGIPL